MPELQRALPEPQINVVADGPDDGTEALCKSLGVSYIQGRNQGLGPAIALGIIRASHDNVIVMDGDGQHPVLAVAGIAILLGLGHPLVFGVRHEDKGMSWVRSFMSDSCALMTRPLCHMQDPMTGLFGLDRRIVQGKNLNPNTWKIALEIAAKTGVQSASVHYQFQQRRAGKSKASLKPAIQFLTQLARLYAWKLDLTQMMRFCVVGTSGLLVNVGIMTFLVELLGIDYRAAAIAGVTTAMLWNYLWNKFWTFKREGHAKSVLVQQPAGERAASLGQGKAEA